jgi:phi13 family phage major tail protein
MTKGNVTIGLDMFHYAVMIDEDTETYSEPVHIPRLMTANVSPIVNTANLSADDKIAETADAIVGANITIGLADIPHADQAALLGHTIDANGVLVRKGTDQAPYVAIGYRRRMANGKYRYVWNYKGRFRPFEDNAETKGETINFQTPSIQATFLLRDKDDQWQAVVNEGDEGFTDVVKEAWFDAVYETTADTTPPTVTVEPADAATEVAADSNVVWTFNEAIRANTINSSNFMLLDADNAPVAGALGYDSTAKIVTFNPTEALTAAAKYTAIVTTGVKDLAGNALAAASITTFTVAT